MKAFKISFFLFCLFLFSNSYSQNTLGGIADEGTLKVEIYNTTNMQVYRYTNGAWVGQWYDPTAVGVYNKSYSLYVNGTSYSGANFGGYFASNRWDDVVDNKIDNNHHEQTSTKTGIVEVKQIIYYPANSATVKYTYEVKNISGGTLSNLRFFTGGDTYLEGDDAGYGYWNAGNKAVGVTNTISGKFVNLYLKSTGEVPFNHESDLYSTSKANVIAGALNGVVNAAYHDNSLALEWRKASLANGATWTLTCEEVFLNKNISDLTVLAPAGETISPNQTKDITFTVENTSASTINSISLAQLIDLAGWTATVTNPVGSFNLAAGATQNVTVSVHCAAGATVGTVAQATLTATYLGVNDADDIAYLTVVAPSCGSSLTSAVGTDNQTVCKNSAITSIKYSTTSATGITSAGLPTGVSAAWASDEITISGSPSVAGTYDYTITLTGGTCSGNTATGRIVVDPTSVGGTVSSDQTICSGSTPSDLTLSGNTGSVTKWQSSTNSSFTPIGTTDIINTTTTLTGVAIGALTTTTYFRAIVQSGSCLLGNSAYATITVDPTTVVGSVSSNQTICSGSTPADLTLSGNTGSVTKWQKATNSSFTGATDITNTTTTLTGAAIGALTTTTYFRAVVQSGSCLVGNSAYATITVDPTTVAGTVSSNQTICSGSTPADLALSGNTGSVTKWQSSTNSSFTPIGT
ncbi:MAG: hypothetical protein WCK02_09030, partial [Bacteroidota bacterium]